jgi:hypothetical protein
MGVIAAEVVLDDGTGRMWAVIGLLVTFVPATWYFAWWICDGVGSQRHRRFVWRNLWLLALATGVAGLWALEGNPVVVAACYTVTAATLLGSCYWVLNRELGGGGPVDREVLEGHVEVAAARLTDPDHDPVAG